MSQLQCFFCSTSNPADAMACSACGRPLNRSAPLEGSVERVSDAAGGTAVMALERAPHPGDGNTRPFSRRPLPVIIGAGLVAVMAALLFAPAHRSDQSTSPAESAVTPPSTPAESGAAAERSGAVQAESGAPASPPAQHPTTAERDSTPLSLMEGMRRAAARGESAAATQPAEAAPRTPAVRNTVAGGSNVGSTVGGGAAAAVSKNAAACTDGMAALGLCQSAPAPAASAARIGSSPDTAQRPAKDDVNKGCTDAAAALALCAQTTTRGN